MEEIQIREFAALRETIRARGGARPLAFLAGIGLSRAPRRSELVLPLTTLGLAAAVELVLLRLFPGGGRFPFSLPEFAAACVSPQGDQTMIEGAKALALTALAVAANPSRLSTT